MFVIDLVELSGFYADLPVRQFEDEAAALLRSLVMGGLPVVEARSEAIGLERLFARSEEGEDR